MLRRAIALSGFLFMLTVAAASFIVVPNGASRANVVNATFLIPASDGYGIADCLTTGNACGVIVADAWCEAHGYSRAATFGAAIEEVTGSTSASLTERSARPISITCAN
jgi:hypothetical protein